MLGESIVIEENEKFKHFTSLTIFPKGNLHFIETCKEYMDMLSNNDNRFVSVTYEDFLSTCNKHKTNDRVGKWLDYLVDRYIIKKMKAETVYKISAFLSLDEKQRLYKMLQEHIRDSKRKTKRKTPLITNEEVDRYLLEYVYNVRFEEE